MVEPKNDRRYWFKLEAQRYLGVGRAAFLGLVEQGHIGVLSIPGLPDRYLADDVRRLVRQGTRPASPGRELIEA